MIKSQRKRGLIRRPFFIWKMLSFLSKKCYNYVIDFNLVTETLKQINGGEVAL